MKGNLLIAVLAFLLLGGIVRLAGYQYRTNENVFLSYFQEHQYLHAVHLSDQIKKLLWNYQQVLEAIPSFASNITEDIEHIKRGTEALSSRLERGFVSEISSHDDTGSTVYPKATCSRAIRRDFTSIIQD